MPALHTAGKAKVYVETLGCSKNRVDSEIMLHHLSQNHYTLTPEPQEADAIVVNTCAFLTSATEESVQRILELSEFKETGRCSTLVAAGCLSQRYREDLLKELPELDALLGSQDFSEIVPLLDQVRREPGKQHSFVQAKPHYQQFEDQEKQQSTPRHFAYVKIAEGCSNMCSFCNIPMLRGLLSSRSVPSIVHEIQQLVSRGVKEINLISQDTSSFGRDRGQLELAELLRSISALEGDFWVRLFYCYPNTFTDEALAAFARDKRFCAYLDMPFQHIEDNVLRKMNRKITRSQIEQKMQIGCMVTLRRERMWSFLDRLVQIALPRVKDFRGISPKGFDGKGNYNLGIKEQLIFPEIDFDQIDRIRGMNVSIVTTAQNDQLALSLLKGLGFPFRK